jgi:NitT/TauT family transport system substrate-binding protein
MKLGRLSRAALAAVPIACTLLAFAFLPSPARADDDVLTLIGSDFPPNVSDVEDIVAEKAGYFKENHVIVNKTFAPNASACFASIATGRGDICISSVEPAIIGYSKGVRIKFFLNRHPIYDYTLAVLSTSPIKTLADFKGADLGETGLGSPSEVQAGLTLAGAGLHRSDYSFTAIGVGPAALTALTTKKVDGVTFPMQELAMDTAATGITFRTFTNPTLRDVPNSGFGATDATLATKGDALKRYARAMVESFFFVRVNPRASAEMFLEGTNQRVTPELLATITRQIVSLEPLFPAYDLSEKRVGFIPIKGMALYCRDFSDAGLTPALVPATDLITNAFVSYANDFDHKAVIAKAKAWR